MRARAFVTLAALAAVASGVPVGAVHDFAGCGSAGATEIVLDELHMDEVDDGQVDRWWVTIPEGSQGFLHVQPLNGDVDIYACVSKADHVCVSHNAYPLGDGCHLEELSVPDNGVINPPAWGPPLEGGRDYRILIQHCFSSADEGNCDYDPTGGGNLDAAPAVQYLLYLTLV